MADYNKRGKAYRIIMAVLAVIIIFAMIFSAIRF